MDDLEEIRKRKLRELQEQKAAAADPDPAAVEAAKAQEEAATERFLQQVLDEAGRARLVRIRMSRPDLADAVVRTLVSMAQYGRLRNRLTDSELRQILARLAPAERDISIRRK